jgi:hypothetical protein
MNEPNVESVNFSFGLAIQYDEISNIPTINSPKIPA